MIKYCLNLVCIFLVVHTSFAQYAVSNIPEELMEGTDVVIRNDFTEIEIHNIAKSTERGIYAVTILNSKGKRFATKGIYYQEAFVKSVSMTGELYDSNGKLIKKLKKKDLADVSAVSGGTLYGDSRMLVASLEHNQYPYTVVFRHEMPRKDRILTSAWMAQSSEKQAVQDAKLIVKMPQGLDLQYKNLLIEKEPEVEKSGSQTAYTWHIKNLKPIEREYMAPSISNLFPTVLLTMADFKWDQFQGSSRSWEDYGKFYYELNAGRDELPEELKNKVKQLCANVDDPNEKIRILYEFVQKNTRYVSVQLGIGGWQTYDAEYVYKNGYGDCKALSNYMQGLLKEVGIPSYPANIFAGDEGLSFQVDFPSSQFNHRILCVPMAQDTLWLECTSSENPTGYLGDFTEDKYALLFTPQGGKLVRTPNSPAEVNLQKREATVTLEANGNAQVEVNMTYTGYQQDNISQVALTLGAKDQESWLKKRIDAGSFQLEKFAFEQNKIEEIPTWNNTYSLKATQWAGVSGSRIFLKPNVLERRKSIPPKVENRQQPVKLTYPYLDVDSITYILPVNYRIESIPDMPVKIVEDFGTYEANIIQKDPRTLIYVRKIKMEKMTLPPEAYETYRNFIRAIVKADKLQIVLSDKS